MTKKKYLIACGSFSASTRPFSNREILFIIFNADLRFANRKGFMHPLSLQWEKKMRTVHIYADRQMGNIIIQVCVYFKNQKLNFKVLRSYCLKSDKQIIL